MIKFHKIIYISSLITLKSMRISITCKGALSLRNFSTVVGISLPICIQNKKKNK